MRRPLHAKGRAEKDHIPCTWHVLKMWYTVEPRHPRSVVAVAGGTGCQNILVRRATLKLACTIRQIHEPA